MDIIAKSAFITMCFGYLGMIFSMMLAPENNKLREFFFEVAAAGSIVLILSAIFFIGGSF